MIAPAVPLEDKVRFLLQPASYPQPTGTVEAVETHMSWVFLAEHFAYKLKKPAKTSFLDYSTVALRKHFCEEEIRLNRRLAPRIYLTTLPLTYERGTLTLNGTGTAVDWLVEMRRVERARMLDVAIAGGTLTPDWIERLAQRLIAFYRSAERIQMAPRRYRERITQAISEDAAALRNTDGILALDRVAFVCEAQLTFVRRTDLLDVRAQEGHIVEAHGDLRPEHVVLEDEPQILDCLEFNAEFRQLDPIDELAFFNVECDMLDASAIGRCVLERYAEGTGDQPPRPLVNFYRSRRAMLRSKLAFWHLLERGVSDPERWRRTAQRYLELAATYADEVSPA